MSWQHHLRHSAATDNVAGTWKHISVLPHRWQGIGGGTEPAQVLAGRCARRGCVLYRSSCFCHQFSRIKRPCSQGIGWGMGLMKVGVAIGMGIGACCRCVGRGGRWFVDRVCENEKKTCKSKFTGCYFVASASCVTLSQFTTPAEAPGGVARVFARLRQKDKESQKRGSQTPQSVASVFFVA